MKITEEEYSRRREAIREGYLEKLHAIYEAAGERQLNNEEHKAIRENMVAEENDLIKLRRDYYAGVEVGDGVTVCYYSDKEAFTVIKRTAKTLTIQRDTAILNPDFVPEWIAGGFAGHCINQSEQTYTYERNPNGATYTARWSEKRGSWVVNGNNVIIGRHEFYDYNF